MDTIILPTPSLHGNIDTPRSEKTSTKRPRLTSFSETRESTISWGRRHHHGSWIHSLGCAGVMILCPTLVIFIWIALSSFDASLAAVYDSVVEIGFINFLTRYGPRSSLKATIGYLVWIVFQVTLYQFLPSKLSSGQLTPAGNLLKYRTNGLLAWIVTHLLFVLLAFFSYLNPAMIAQNWEGLLFMANVFGFLVPVIAFIKAHVAPTHVQDRKFSGSWVYDFFMGIELNPRFGKLFDFKLFTNGRPGIVAWTLIDFSFIAFQYQLHGYITKSILIATILHTIYVVDFFINEDWYLRTIDICHDHFGFYLAWGSFVWLPGVYTLQTQYLARNPLELSNLHALTILITGVGGYILFRSVNHQKDLVRRTKGDCILWGQKAKIVHVKYRTSDGVEHNSLLLCSGWWGFARHVNYLGDLILSFSMCATCGFNNILPWTYAIFMTTLLVHRCWRDEERCSKKYGQGWEEYCKRVKWVIVPGIY